MELLCTAPAQGADEPARVVNLRCEIANPVRGEWAVAHATGDDFTGAVGERPSAGWVVDEITIRAPDGGTRDVLALDAIWIWTDAPAGN